MRTLDDIRTIWGKLVDKFAAAPLPSHLRGEDDARNRHGDRWSEQGRSAGGLRPDRAGDNRAQNHAQNHVQNQAQNQAHDHAQGHAHDHAPGQAKFPAVWPR